MKAETRLLPGLTVAQLSYINRFRPPIEIKDISKPHEDLWEIKGYLGTDILRRRPVYLWLTEDAKTVANADESQNGDTGTTRIFRNFNVKSQLGDADMEITDHQHGLHNLDRPLDEVREKAIELVKNRAWPDLTDIYGRTWHERFRPTLCPICGQPYSGKCDHDRLDNETATFLREG